MVQCGRGVKAALEKGGEIQSAERRVLPWPSPSRFSFLFLPLHCLSKMASPGPVLEEIYI